MHFITPRAANFGTSLFFPALCTIDPANGRSYTLELKKKARIKDNTIINFSFSVD